MSDTFLGLDRSGNDNNFTVNNLTLAADQMVDSPTNNFGTFNPLAYRTVNSPTVTWSEGNLKVNLGIYGETYGNFFPSTGKWYFELLIHNLAYGITIVLAPSSNGARGIWNPSIGYSNNGDKEINNSYSSYGATYTTGDIISVAVDFDGDNVIFYKNGSTQGTISGSLTAGLGYGLMLSEERSGTHILNCGQDSSFAGNKTAQGNQDGNGIGDFYYTPPANHLAICTSNFDTPAVTPSEHFNTVLYSGNSGTNAITGVGFQPDFTWIKGRDVSVNHFLFDAVRGVTKWLKGDITAAEGTNSNSLTTFGSDGFIVGSETDVNNSGEDFVAWNWKANGSGSANTDGDMAETVTVSANTDAGFSIVTYTGDGSTATVGHGLSKAPEFIVVKTRSHSGDWMAYHSGNTAAPETDFLKFNENNATEDLAAVWNDTAPTSSVFTIGDNTDVNVDDRTYVAYCFHSVDGYSKFGSYTGNADADGTFVYTGFRPAFVIIKPSSRGGHWFMANNESNPYNVVDKVILTNDSAAEYTDPAADCKKDFLSNGFKLRTTDDNTNDDETYIYIAFAETPFKYANAR